MEPALKLSVPLLLGAAVGLIAAENLSDMRTIRVTVFALGIAALLVVLNPSKWLSADIAEPDRAPGPLITVAVFAVGAWAGLIVGSRVGAMVSLGPNASRWVYSMLLVVLAGEAIRLGFLIL